MLKSTFMGYTMSLTIRLAVVGYQICEITRNFERIRTYGRSRSSKVIDLDVKLSIESEYATAY